MKKLIEGLEYIIESPIVDSSKMEHTDSDSINDMDSGLYEASKGKIDATDTDLRDASYGSAYGLVDEIQNNPLFKKDKKLQTLAKELLSAQKKLDGHLKVTYVYD